jgi:nucleotide-binding universal stress UspA family protein
MAPTTLVALDGSKNAERVLPFVEPLLRSVKGRAWLIQVLPPGAEGPEAAAQAYLREISSRLARKKIRSESEIVRGDPAVAIVRAAEDQKADLVAFTSHGQGGLSQWVFGSVAQKILRGCSRPLLVVRALEEPAPRVKRILVPLDGALGSEASGRSPSSSSTASSRKAIRRRGSWSASRRSPRRSSQWEAMAARASAAGCSAASRRRCCRRRSARC